MGFAYAALEATSYSDSPGSGGDGYVPGNWPEGWDWPSEVYPPLEGGSSTTMPGDVWINVTPAAIEITSGDTVNIYYQTGFATSVSVNGTALPGLYGYYAVSPTTTTVYTFTAVGEGDNATDTCTVTVGTAEDPTPELIITSPTNFDVFKSGETFDVIVATSYELTATVAISLGTSLYDGSLSGTGNISLSSAQTGTQSDLAYTLATDVDADLFTVKASMTVSSITYETYVILGCVNQEMVALFVDSSGVSDPSEDVTIDDTNNEMEWTTYVLVSATDSDDSVVTDYDHQTRVRISGEHFGNYVGDTDTSIYIDAYCPGDEWDADSATSVSGSPKYIDLPSAAFSGGYAMVRVQVVKDLVAYDLGGPYDENSAYLVLTGLVEPSGGGGGTVYAYGTDTINIIGTDTLDMSIDADIVDDTATAVTIDTYDGMNALTSSTADENVTLTAEDANGTTVQLGTAQGVHADSIEVTLDGTGAYSGNLYFSLGGSEVEPITLIGQTTNEVDDYKPYGRAQRDLAKYLEFTTEPTDVNRGVNFTLALRVKDANGNTVTDEAPETTLTLAGADGSDVLSKTTIATGEWSSGTWTSSTMQITGGSGAETGVTISASATGYTGDTTAEFTITVLYENDLVSSSADKIYIHDGIAASISTSFSSPATTARDLAYDGSNLISCDQGTNKIYIHSGITSSIGSSFSAPWQNIYGLTYDGSNLVSCDHGADKIYIHSGVTVTISDSFSAPATFPSGLTYDGSNLISADAVTNKIYVHSGVTVSISTSFAAPASDPRGLAYDGSNLISNDYTSEKAYVHDGVSASITNSFSVSGAGTLGLTYTG